MEVEVYRALRAPFPYRDIEWRIARAGKKGDKLWAKCFAYITSRAIMDRLDETVGPGGWQVEYQETDAHLRAGIGIQCGGEWVWKWDGTGFLDVTGGLSRSDAGKGDHSLALKRAAVLWGIGRYLYELPEGWAQIHSGGAYWQSANKKKGLPAFNWDPPALPDWAQPGGSGRQEPPEVDPDTGEVKDLDEMPLGVDLETLKNRALNAELISTDQAATIDGYARESNEEMMRKSVDRLKGLLAGDEEDAAA